MKTPPVLLIIASLACVGAITGLTAAHDAVPVVLPYLASGFAVGAGVSVPTVASAILSAPAAPVAPVTASAAPAAPVAAARTTSPAPALDPFAPPDAQPAP